MLITVFKGHYIYTVRKGDTLYSIAKKWNSSIQSIELANHLFEPVTDPGFIFPGNVLVIPSLSETKKITYIVKSGDTVSGISSRFSTFPDLISGINNLKTPNHILVNQLLIVPAFLYEIQSGDTLSSISRKFGITLSNITKTNQSRPGFQKDLIWPGFQLVIPLPTSRNAVVWTPFPGTNVSSNQKIEGQVRAFEANVLHQLRDINGIIVSKENFTTADEGTPKYGNFTNNLLFDKIPISNTGELWVYTKSSKDGRIQDLLKIKIYF